jgi:hypothetical protein
MFGLSATLAPKLNGIQVGFPYVMQFMMERNAERLAHGSTVVKTEPRSPDKPEKHDKPEAKPEKAEAKSDTKDEVLLN